MNKIRLSNDKLTLVDKKDFITYNKFKWHCIKRGRHFHVYRRSNNKTIYLHREILKAKKGQIVDHINRNGLDNRRSNLRIVNKSKNANNAVYRHNTSGYRGVSMRKNENRNKPYRCYINYNGKQYFLGNFRSAIEAAKKYDEAAIKYFGKNTYLNFPKKCES